MKIVKGLKTCGEGIQNALKRYNLLAKSMEPPAPKLNKDDIFSYTFIAEFDLLKHTYSQEDVHTKAWTIPTNCQIAAKYFKCL